jgi:hypothetical protein
MQANRMVIFDCHGNAAVRRGAHCLMEHIQGFTRSHWKPPSVECLRRITPAAAMVKECERHFGPWLKSPLGYNFLLLIFMLLLF